MKAALSAITIALALLPISAHGDLVFTSTGATTLIDFETTLTGSNNGQFTGAGFSPGATSAGQLDSNSWAVSGFSDGDVDFGDTATTGDFARGADNGGVSTGGIYAFDSSLANGANNGIAGGSVGLGVQPIAADFAPGTFTLRTMNGTGTTIGTVSLSYDIFAHNDQGRANSFNFSWSTDGTMFTDVSVLDFTSTEADANEWESQLNNTVSISGLSLANGDQFYLRWSGEDVSGTGSRDEFSLDNIGITMSVPEPSTYAILGVLAMGGLTLHRRRRKKA